MSIAETKAINSSEALYTWQNVCNFGGGGGGGIILSWLHLLSTTRRGRRRRRRGSRFAHQVAVSSAAASLPAAATFCRVFRIQWMEIP